MYEWMVDSGQVPYILVDAAHPDAQVPQGYAQNGKIVLNLATTATQGLSLGNELIEFQARFNGRPLQVKIPVAAVLAIYARETGQGMMFSADDEPPAQAAGQPSSDKSGERAGRAGGKPSLKIIK